MLNIQTPAMAEQSKRKSATYLWAICQIIIIYIISIIAVAIIINSCALGITDIVMAKLFADSTCHIKYLSIYLYVNGTVALINMVFVLFVNKKDEACLKALCIIVGILMPAVACWGMSLVWNTSRGDCPAIYYNYAYYRTVIYMFVGIVTVCIAVIMLIINFWGITTTAEKRNHPTELDENNKKILAVIDSIINTNPPRPINANNLESVV